jgi:hypothetical protein
MVFEFITNSIYTYVNILLFIKISKNYFELVEIKTVLKIVKIYSYGLVLLKNTITSDLYL